MACRSEDCQYWRWCRVRSAKNVEDKFQCAEFYHLDDIAQDAKDIEREYHYNDEDDMEEDDE